MWKEPAYVPNRRQLCLFYPSYKSLGSTLLRGYVLEWPPHQKARFPTAAYTRLESISAQGQAEWPWGTCDKLTSSPPAPPGTMLQGHHGSSKKGFSARWKSSESGKSGQLQWKVLNSNVTSRCWEKTTKYKRDKSFLLIDHQPTVKVWVRGVSRPLVKICLISGRTSCRL